jgi:WD40 repeat protein
MGRRSNRTEPPECKLPSNFDVGDSRSRAISIPIRSHPCHPNLFGIPRHDYNKLWGKLEADNTKQCQKWIASVDGILKSEFLALSLSLSSLLICLILSKNHQSFSFSSSSSSHPAPATMSSSTTYKYFLISSPSPYVAHVQINRPSKLNAFHEPMWLELGSIFSTLSHDPSVRAVVFSGAGDKAFTAGLDVTAATQGGILGESTDRKLDIARQATNLRRHIDEFQRCITSIEACEKRES